LKLRSSSIVRDPQIHFLNSVLVLTRFADQVAEAAVVGINDELTGQAVNAFVALKDGTESSDQVKKELILQVRKSIGPFAAPKAIFVVPDLPKTRSGKIMRRIMRKILAGEEDQLGDITTVSVVPLLPS
jgi:acetyl-CoA synthetase